MRHSIPTEQEKFGDYYGPGGGNWPTNPASDQELLDWSLYLEKGRKDWLKVSID
jgi:hypothetical protein